MKIDFSEAILDLDGKRLQNEGKDMTLASVACTALLIPDPNDRDVNAERKIARFVLAQKVYNGSVQDLSVEEIAMLKELIGKAYAPLVVGRAYALLDPREASE